MIIITADKKYIYKKQNEEKMKLNIERNMKKNTALKKNITDT